MVFVKSGVTFKVVMAVVIWYRFLFLSLSCYTVRGVYFQAKIILIIL